MTVSEATGIGPCVVKLEFREGEMNEIRPLPEPGEGELYHPEWDWKDDLKFGLVVLVGMTFIAFYWLGLGWLLGVRF